MAFNVSDYLPCQWRKKIKKSVRLQTSVCWYLFTQIPIVKDSLVLTKTKLNLSHIIPQKGNLISRRMMLSATDTTCFATQQKNNLQMCKSATPQHLT